MDEVAKTEARNYLSAAGFFVLAASFLLLMLFIIMSSTFNELVHRHFVWVTPRSLSNYLRMKVSLFPLPTHFIQQSN